MNKKLAVLGATMACALAAFGATSSAAQADIVVAPALPVVGTPVHLVIKAPIDLNWI